VARAGAAAFQAGGVLPRDGVGLVDVLQDVAHPAEVVVTGLGQGQAARAALEQPRAQVLFQVSHQAGDDRWRHVQRARGTGKAAFIHHALEITDSP